MLTALLPLAMPQEKERKIEELRARRKDHIRTVLMSQNFLLGAGWSLSQVQPHHMPGISLVCMFSSAVKFTGCLAADTALIENISGL